MLTRVRDELGLIIEPALRLLSLFIENLIGSILVPIVGLQHRENQLPARSINAHLRSVGVRDTLSIDPVLRLLVFRIVDLLGRSDGRVEVLEKAT